MATAFRTLQSRLHHQDMTLGEKLRQISWTYLSYNFV